MNNIGVTELVDARAIRPSTVGHVSLQKSFPSVAITQELMSFCTCVALLRMRVLIVTIEIHRSRPVPGARAWEHQTEELEAPRHRASSAKLNSFLQEPQTLDFKSPVQWQTRKEVTKPRWQDFSVCRSRP